LVITLRGARLHGRDEVLRQDVHLSLDWGMEAHPQGKDNREKAAEACSAGRE
jgi:hypothetical protein